VEDHTSGLGNGFWFNPRTLLLGVLDRKKSDEGEDIGGNEQQDDCTVEGGQTLAGAFSRKDRLIELLLAGRRRIIISPTATKGCIDRRVAVVEGELLGKELCTEHGELKLMSLI
jgi:hypothetical protein